MTDFDGGYPEPRDDRTYYKQAYIGADAPQDSGIWLAVSCLVTGLSFVLVVAFAMADELHLWNGALLALTGLAGVFGVASEAREDEGLKPEWTNRCLCPGGKHVGGRFDACP